jgi:hypothetical protein
MSIATIVCALALLISTAEGRSQTRGEPSATKESLARSLDEVARVATVMVDGDLCQKIMTRRSADLMFAVDPKDQWAASDNFDVNHEPYIQTKKTLIRLSRLCSVSCDVNLWMPFPTNPAKIQILIRNVNELSQFWPWGALNQDMIPEMKQVLETGERRTVMRRPGIVSVLAPVYNSLGDIVALVEAVSRERRHPEESVR